MATDITTDSSSRFTIFVPKPNTRINMGKPDPDTPFGYKGLSMQTDATMFADVNKLILFQSWKDACFQAIGKWTQWADAGMWMGSVANTTLTSGAKMLVVAGASQSHDMLLDHGLGHVTPRMIEYNNLELHYRIEEVHNGLKKFFYGKDWKTPEKTVQGPVAAIANAPVYAPVVGQQNEFFSGTYPAGSFLKKLHTLMEDLGYDDDATNKLNVLQPLEWEGDYLDMTMSPASAYSALRTFDPYPAQGWSGFKTMVYAGFVQVVNWLKRTVDVMRRLALSITENALGKRVQALVTAWGNAQDGLNNILNSADIARFDRDTGKANAYGDGGGFADEKNSFGKRLPAWSSASAATAAKLTSLGGPFDISAVSAANAYIDVRDVASGTLTRVTFDELLVAQKATISLATSSDFTSIAASSTSVAAPTLATPVVQASVTLGGTAVAFTRTAVIDTSVTPHVITSVDDVWSSLPSGFLIDANGYITKTDGSPFTVAVANGVTFVDNSFTSGDTLKVTIDGTPFTVSLTGLNTSGSATVGSDRAASLVSAINAQHGGAASAAGNVVTILSDRVGTVARIEASATLATTKKLTGGSGALSLAAVGKDVAVALLVRDLAAKLSGANKNFAVASGSEVKLTHNVTGKVSHIEISGPLAATFFGSSPASSTGTDKKELTFWNNLSDMRNLQFEIAKWPEDARHLVRPVTDALSDVVSGLSKSTKDVFDSMMSAIIGVQPKTMALGLIAKDGITLGTSKAIYGAGQSITFVASPPSDPDDDKFVPGVEKLANWVLTFGDAWTKAQWDKFKPLKKKPNAEPKGDFRIVAAQDIISTAGRNLRHVALDTSWFEGDKVTVHSKTKTHVTSRTGQVHIQGKSVAIGDVVQDAEAKQAPTETVLIQCQNSVDVRTTKLRMHLDDAGDKILIGKHAALPGAVDPTKPHLRLDLTAGAEKLEVGFTNGSLFGLSVAHDGKVGVNANTKLELSVQGGAAITVGAADVQIAKHFKVGTALLVKGDGVFVKAPVIAMPQVAVRPPLITAEYLGAIALATAQKLIVTGCDLAMVAAGAIVANAGMGLGVIYAMQHARNVYDLQEGLRNAAIVQLQNFGGQCQQLLDEGRLYDMTPAQVGQTPLDAAIFAVPPAPPRP